MNYLLFFFVAGNRIVRTQEARAADGVARVARIEERTGVRVGNAQTAGSALSSAGICERVCAGRETLHHPTSVPEQVAGGTCQNRNDRDVTGRRPVLRTTRQETDAQLRNSDSATEPPQHPQRTHLQLVEKRVRNSGYSDNDALHRHAVQFRLADGRRHGIDARVDPPHSQLQSTDTHTRLQLRYTLPRRLRPPEAS